MEKYYLIKISESKGRKKLPKIIGRFQNMKDAKKACKDRLDRTPEHVRCSKSLLVVDLADYNMVLKKIKKQLAEYRALAVKKAAKTRKKNGTVAHFVLCPTCDSKSKKLFSEMGGLQTRKCRNGHYFEVDTFFGFETDKRRVERVDRPVYTGPMSYTDYVYGKYKNDPNGNND